MVERILIAVEDSDERMGPVVDHAAEIAAGLGAEVLLYHVYSPDGFEAQLESLGLESADPVELAKGNATVEAAAARLREAGVGFSVGAATGDAADELVAAIGDHGVDHVFLGAHGRSPAGKALLGSVSADVMRRAEVPCTVVMS